jgi:hypothetical protein
MEKIIAQTGDAKLVFTVPLPRYVLVACCCESSHVSNWQDPEFLTEISGSERCLTEAAAAGEWTAEARILNMLGFFGPLESALQELTTVDGTSIWAGDGVHLTSNASRVTALKLMLYIATEGAGSEPPNKRARLESVIPTQAEPKLPKPNITQPPPPKTGPAAVVAARSVTGAQRGRGAGGHQRGPQKGGRGGQGPRGGHTLYRTAGPPAARGVWGLKIMHALWLNVL